MDHHCPGDCLRVAAVTRYPKSEANRIIHLLKMNKSSAFARLLFKDVPGGLKQSQASDHALDLMIKDWQKAIAGPEDKLIKMLDRYYAAQTRQQEDDIIERAEEIKRQRGI